MQRLGWHLAFSSFRRAFVATSRVPTSVFRGSFRLAPVRSQQVCFFTSLLFFPPFVQGHAKVNIPWKLFRIEISGKRKTFFPLMVSKFSRIRSEGAAKTTWTPSTWEDLRKGGKTGFSFRETSSKSTKTILPLVPAREKIRKRRKRIENAVGAFSGRSSFRGSELRNGSCFGCAGLPPCKVKRQIIKDRN